jgi:sugar phosphate isomerase/epimerase
MSSSNSFKKSYPIWEILDWASRNGFEGVELVNGWPQGPYPDPDDKARCAALKGFYDRYGLKIAALQSSPGGRPHAPEAGERAKWVEGFRRQARLGKALGAEVMGMWPGGALGDQTIDQALGHLIDSYRQAAAICGELGLIAAFEIEPPFVFNTADHLLRIFDGVRHPAFRGIYDPSHYDQISGATLKPENLLKRVVGRIGYIQFTDTDGTIVRGTSHHVACGDGKIDVRASLRTLWDGNYRGWFMIDAWDTEDPYDASLKGKRAMEAFLAEATLKL